MRSLALSVLVTLASACAASAPHATLDRSKQTRAGACERPEDCVVVPVSCCGFCGAPAHGDARAALRSSLTTRDECLRHGCGDCHRDPDPQLAAYCSQRGACRLLDLTEGPLVRCTTDADCTMVPLQCCECGADAWVAVASARAAAVSGRICPRPVACPECVGRGGTAVCRDSRCQRGP